MSFTHRPGKRESLSLLIGLAGGTGSGKTYSAMRLASGLSGGKPFAVIDTENGRANFYADSFTFEHGQIVKPFRPATYVEAIEVYDKEAWPVIVVDSMSHEYAGDGGVLDWHEEQLDEFVDRAKKAGDNRADWQIEEANKMRAWIVPKLAHKAMMSRLLQVRAHLILCFRAEPKTEIAKENGKTVIREKKGLMGLGGWFPVCEKNMPFEMTTYLLMTQDAPGVPRPITLREPHKPFFPLDRPITEEAGMALGEWARGGTVQASQQTDSHPHGISPDDIPMCDLCKIKLVWRPGKKGGEDFLACTGWQKHRDIEIIIPLSKLVRNIQERQKEPA